MKKIIICIYLLGSLCCCAKTMIQMTLPDKTVVKFFDNKTRTGTTVDVKTDGTKITGFIYKSETSDANSVALKALSVADQTLKTLATVPK